MKRLMKRFSVALAGATLLIAAGCFVRTEHKIDAHITLDIRHIEEQASDVLDYVEGKSDTLPGFESDGAAADDTSWLQWGVDAIMPIRPVYAAELKSNSALVREIAGKLRENHAAIEKLKQQGCLGENNRGYAELRECDALDGADKMNAAQKLVAEENKHRKALYGEIARLNAEENVTVSMVERIYANERLDRAKSGEVYQLPPEGDDLDSFKKSALGRKLGDKAKPGAWVTIP